MTKPIPDAPQRVPLLGNLVPLLRDPLAYLTSLRDHGDLVRVRIGPLAAVVVCTPALTDQVLRNDRVFDRGGPFFDRLGELLGDSLVVCPHQRHRRQRRLVQPAFHPARLPAYAGVMTARIAERVGSWQDGQVLDVVDEMVSLTAGITVATMFGDALSPSSLRQALDDLAVVFAGVTRRILVPPPLDRLPTPGSRRDQRAAARLRATLGEVVAERRAGTTDHGDLLSALLSAGGPDDGGLTDTELVDQLLAFFGAGTETAATTLSWALHLLDRHPEIGDRVHAEARTVLAGSPAALGHLPHLELTSRVVTETLRLRPPGWVFTRTAAVDTDLAGHPIPAGTTVVYSPYLLHHRPDQYADPELFDPDRWDLRRPAPAREAFVPFGGGARKCIGDRFALTEITLALATIVARWSLRTPPGQRVRPALGAALTPKGLLMRVSSW
ncbi:cytochrome P450 [Lentzea sp. NPDC059081]|uniref:cytochrome P450 n=1 Tax=Lentzea sp. NPDC059081 TaxID=3346719 RepID=UPI0036886683